MNPSLSNQHVVIVGAGPIGLELAVALKWRGIRYTVVEAGAVGQTISWWAPQTRWFSSNERIAIAGVPLLTADQSKANREQYLNYLRGVATQFQLEIRTYTKVTDVCPVEEGQLRVVTESDVGKKQIEASAVVLAIGGTDFPKKLGVPGEQLSHVDGYLRETHRYYGRRVLIIGGRNSAIEAALRLHHAGAEVLLSYRGENLPDDGIKYWLLPEIKGLLASGRIKNYLGTVPVEFVPGGAVLESTVLNSTVLNSTRDETRTEVQVDDVLSLIGYEQDKSLLRSAGVTLQGEYLRPVFDEDTMQTNVPGIYVAGTATAGTQSSKYKTFLENCHDHVDKIIAHLSGSESSQSEAPYQRQIEIQPES